MPPPSLANAYAITAAAYRAYQAIRAACPHEGPCPHEKAVEDAARAMKYAFRAWLNSDEEREFVFRSRAGEEEIVIARPSEVRELLARWLRQIRRRQGIARPLDPLTGAEIPDAEIAIRIRLPSWLDG